MTKQAIIIGAGPAGLTAAYELLQRTGIKPILLEMTQEVGGISKTVEYEGNRVDFGGHRFFSKSDRVMDWWLDIMPIEKGAPLPGGGFSEGPDPEHDDHVMLLRKRLSRIYYMRRFFDYPVTLRPQTVINLGLIKMVRIALSYMRSMLFPIKNVENIEQLFINRFGRELYETFFKAYTEKVWGVPCHHISAEWGEQRIKDLSIIRAVLHYLRGLLGRSEDISQKDVDTSLIEQFLYPKYGPGQMWEAVAGRITEQGGEIHYGQRVTRIQTDGKRINEVHAVDLDSGEEHVYPADHVFSTMSVKELIAALDQPAPEEVARVAAGLKYRDLVVVGLLVERLKITGPPREDGLNDLIPDTWLYIQEADVRVGRVQVYNNWSPYMVADPVKTVWLGLEYYCNEGDELWTRPDDEFIQFAADELAHIDVIERGTLIGGKVFRMQKTYPAYIESYADFPQVREFVDQFENLFLIGRNGMHRYNNQDHSMLTAMTAVDNIVADVQTRDNIWSVNTEQVYHEQK